jgi:hypothetical protein
MTTTQLLENAIVAVGNSLGHHQCIFTNGKALALRVESARLEFMNRILSTSGEGSPLHIQRGHPEIEVILGLDSAARFLSAKAISEAVTGSPEFIEAAAVLEPLIAEVRHLEAQVAQENEAAGKRAAERESAIAAATAAALAEVEARFAEALPPAPAEAPPLIRGRQKLETALA